MKKLLLSLFMMAGLASFAQQDISLTLTSPSDGDTIRQRVPFNVTYTIKNVGPALSATDTIIVLFTLNGNVLTSNGVPVFQRYTRALDTDSSFSGGLANVPLAFTSAGSASICAIAILDQDTVNETNNGDCASVVLAFNSGVSEIEKAANSVKVFPNPASSVVNFTIDYNKAEKVLVYDIAGKLVETTSFEFNKAELNVSSYNAGIYMYQIVDNNGTTVKAGKFNVQ